MMMSSILLEFVVWFKELIIFVLYIHTYRNLYITCDYNMWLCDGNQVEDAQVHEVQSQQGAQA